MGRGKGITLSGAAGKGIRTDKKIARKYEAIASKIHLLLSDGSRDSMKIACAILSQLETQGLDKTYETHGT